MNTVEINKKSEDLRADSEDILNAKMEDHYKERLTSKLNDNAKDFDYWVDVILKSAKGNKEFFRALNIVFGIKAIDESKIGETIATDIVMDKDFEVIGKFAMMNKLSDKKISAVIEYLFEKSNNNELLEEEKKIKEEVEEKDKNKGSKEDNELREHL